MPDRTCLVVEDSPLMRQLLAFALSRIQGMHVVEADNGAEAARCLISEHFDIVLTDINMPVMDGLELIRRIRTDPVHKDVPVVVITINTSGEDRARAMQAGASLYLTKPIRATQVIAKVSEVLGI